MKAYLDQDGVLAQFVESACAVHGAANPYDCPSGRALGVWDVVKLCNIDPETFWSTLGFEFWANLEPYPDALDIVAAVAEFDPNYSILTSPCRTHGCADGKHDWIRRVLGHASQRRTILCGNKGLVAGPNKVLVDDSDENCAAWEENGGYAILVPRAWNALYDLRHLDIAAYVRQALSAAKEKLYP